ncbi:hypothetical protein [Polyangium sp. y55x31]|uniref:hypothetical protein n=1 Tax=Polyangium sp. y55x31 TaxID=3042688 RepID=UPI0024827DED|nr:hypothetical protein [Polyangium sp. y55x31]MDI1482977.1 hypothetical protein [Polyangium sp. y55x31]
MRFIRPMTFAFALATSGVFVMPSATARADIIIPPSSNYALGADFASSARPGLAGAEIRSLHFLSPLLRTSIVGGGTYIAEVGDIITSVNDRPVLDQYGLARRLQGLSSGTKVKLGIVDVRTGKTVKVWVTLR